MDVLSGFFTTLPAHQHQVVAAFAAYSAIFWILSPLASAHLGPGVYKGLPRRTQIKWHVRVVSFIQSTFISACAIHVLRSDMSRTQIDARERLLGYSPMTGRVQAFAAGYFLWDLLASVLYFHVLGIGSLVHAICALSVTMIGFVSTRIALKIITLIAATASLRELLWHQPRPLRAIEPVYEYTLVHGQIRTDWLDVAAGQRLVLDDRFLRFSSCMGMVSVPESLPRYLDSLVSQRR